MSPFNVIPAFWKEQSVAPVEVAGHRMIYRTAVQTYGSGDAVDLDLAYAPALNITTNGAGRLQNLSAGTPYWLFGQMSVGVVSGQARQQLYNVTDGAHFGPIAKGQSCNSAFDGTMQPYCSRVLTPAALSAVELRFLAGGTAGITGARTGSFLLALSLANLEFCDATLAAQQVSPNLNANVDFDTAVNNRGVTPGGGGVFTGLNSSKSYLAIATVGGTVPSLSSSNRMRARWNVGSPIGVSGFFCCPQYNFGDFSPCPGAAIINGSTTASFQTTFAPNNNFNIEPANSWAFVKEIASSEWGFFTMSADQIPLVGDPIHFDTADPAGLVLTASPTGRIATFSAGETYLVLFSTVEGFVSTCGLVTATAFDVTGAATVSDRSFSNNPCRATTANSPGINGMIWTPSVDSELEIRVTAHTALQDVISDMSWLYIEKLS